MPSHLLASDLNNPDFAGPVNPDSRLTVRFYSKPLQNDFLSAKEGRPIFTDTDFVNISVPGDPTSIVDTPAREDHKARFPLHWAHYQNKHGGDPREIGTPLAQWPRIGAAQAEELRALRFYTVESIASASDQSLQRLGMVAGMSPFAFRDAAKQFLAIARGEAVATANDAKVKALEEERATERAAHDAEMEKLREEMQALRSLMTQAAAAAPKAEESKAKKAA